MYRTGDATMREEGRSTPLASHDGGVSWIKVTSSLRAKVVGWALTEPWRRSSPVLLLPILISCMRQTHMCVHIHTPPWYRWRFNPADAVPAPALRPGAPSLPVFSACYQRSVLPITPRSMFDRHGRQFCHAGNEPLQQGSHHHRKFPCRAKMKTQACRRKHAAMTMKGNVTISRNCPGGQTRGR